MTAFAAGLLTGIGISAVMVLAWLVGGRVARRQAERQS